jgi:hypothetical protein
VAGREVRVALGRGGEALRAARLHRRRRDRRARVAPAAWPRAARRRGVGRPRARGVRLARRRGRARPVDGRVPLPVHGSPAPRLPRSRAPLGSPAREQCARLRHVARACPRDVRPARQRGGRGEHAPAPGARLVREGPARGARRAAARRGVRREPRRREGRAGAPRAGRAAARRGDARARPGLPVRPLDRSARLREEPGRAGEGPGPRRRRGPVPDDPRGRRARVHPVPARQRARLRAVEAGVRRGGRHLRSPRGRARG